jgi:MerR family transcriptional regulator, light-induced transcriptional regulator
MFVACYAAQSMYTIKQAAERTGIAIPTIRVWERRYGVVSPSRTAAGYRLYDEDSIARLGAMQHLVENEGWRPSQAADRIRTASAPELAELGSAARTSDTRDADRARPTGAGAVEAIVDAARRLDLRSIDVTLDETFAGQGFESAMDTVVFPALRAIGDAWSRNELDVAREHAASETIRRRIAHYFDAAARNGGSATVVVGLPPGSRHELGAFAFAVAARRAGLDVVYLGADVPIDAWRQTVRDTRPRAVVVAVVARGDARSASDVIRALAEDDATLVAVGGPSAAGISDELGAIHLPDRFDEAVPLLLEAIGATTR